MLEIDVKVVPTVKEFKESIKRLKRIDFREPLTKLIPDLAASVKDVIKTKGAAIDEPWEAFNSRYLSEKQAAGFGK